MEHSITAVFLMVLESVLKMVKTVKLQLLKRRTKNEPRPLCLAVTVGANH